MELNFSRIVDVKGFFESVRLLIKSRRGVAGLSIITFFTCMVMASFFVPQHLLQYNANKIWLPPSLEHPLGTDFAGRDILAQIVYGSRSVLSSSFLAAFFIILMGTFIGILSGFKGGSLDAILMFIADTLMTIPTYPLFLIMAANLKASLDIFTLSLILAVTSWAGLARAVRSQVMSIKSREFVEASKVLGLPTLHIIFGEILPMIRPYLIVNFLYSTIYSMNGFVGFFFLGLAALDMSNWGVMLNLAMGRGVLMLARSWAILYFFAPVLMILLLTLGMIFLSSGLETVFNPRLREE
ncbi:MAG: ABC transporter permease [Candidatus Bathyarchaeia archaeon]